MPPPTLILLVTLEVCGCVYIGRGAGYCTGGGGAVWPKYGLWDGGG